MVVGKDFLGEAIALAHASVAAGGGPFGAVIVRQGEVVGCGQNRVVLDLDPTAHAEVVAIRAACTQLQRFRLDDCVLYASCEPCPLCLAAAYWARLPEVIYAADRHDAAAAGFDDAAFYDELAKPSAERRLRCCHQPRPQALAVFRQWHELPTKTPY